MVIALSSRHRATAIGESPHTPATARPWGPGEPEDADLESRTQTPVRQTGVCVRLSRSASSGSPGPHGLAVAGVCGDSPIAVARCRDERAITITTTLTTSDAVS